MLRGGKVRRILAHLRTATYSVPASALPALAADPNVRYVSPNRPVRGKLEYANPAVHADLAARAGINGSGIRVAVIDSGINQARDLSDQSRPRSRVVYSESFVDDDKSTVDKFGHGTHVAGIIAGNATTSSAGPRQFHGMGDGIELVNLRVLNAEGVGDDEAVLAAIDRAILLKDLLGIRVINLSLGRPVRESWTVDPLCQAVARAWQAGLVVVVAAGNDGRRGYGSVNSPGNQPNVITVGAVNDRGTLMTGDDIITSYSSKGPTAIDYIAKPDIVAPGNNIVSLAAGNKNSTANLVPWDYYLQTTRPGFSVNYYRLSGTSMAAPMVAGAAALLLDKDPKLSPDTVKLRLMRTARRNFPANPVQVTDLATGTVFNVRHDVFSIGAGYLDVWAALQSTDVAQSAISAQAVRENGAVVLTGSSLIFPDNIIWGGEDAMLEANNIIWGGEESTFEALSTQLHGEQ